MSKSGNGRRTWLIGLGVLVAVLLGAGAALALSGGGSDSTAKSVSAGTTAPSSSTSTSVPAPASSGGTPIKTTPTSSTVLKPVFTQASTSNSTVICDKSTDTPTLTLDWNTEHATSVDIVGGNSGFPTMNHLDSSKIACSKTSLTLLAHGPGGTATATITWRQVTSAEAHKALNP